MVIIHQIFISLLNAPPVVGLEFRNGGSTPVFDSIVLVYGLHQGIIIRVPQLKGRSRMKDGESGDGFNFYRPL
ncbi:hypothetical protein COLO4_10155 [Corchorus olitorius]|uniref:Uncharacterized protein n=1 Tax=Corchorus olitorius TaxID=93759 RepID=A0A1R3K9R9_9ROSI|nr:hypothetical protein COLO4_10155 [Corchorus olitorius]